MRDPYTKIFRDPKKLEEMLDRYKVGWKVFQLERQYQVHFSTILHHIRKNNLIPKRLTIEKRQILDNMIFELQKDLPESKRLLQERIRLNIPTPIKPSTSKYAHIIERGVCQGKSYAEYKRENKSHLDKLVGL